jgi:chemotaxis signal transduction protein
VNPQPSPTSWLARSADVPTLHDEVAFEDNYLVCLCGTTCCAFPLGSVAESMRALHITALEHQPPFVLGVATVRGDVLPVVDLARLLGIAASRPTRFVTLNLGARRVAVAVESVVGVRKLSEAVSAGLPPLLHDLEEGAVSAIAQLDDRLLLILHAARLLPDWVIPTAGEVSGAP